MNTTPENKFTAGPWNEGRADMATIVDGVESKWIYAGKKYIAVASGRDVKSWDEVMANARLIAASPDMAECLVESLVWLVVHCVPQHNPQAARNAFEQLKKCIAALEKAGVNPKMRKEGLAEIESKIAKAEGRE